MGKISWRSPKRGGKNRVESPSRTQEQLHEKSHEGLWAKWHEKYGRNLVRKSWKYSKNLIVELACSIVSESLDGRKYLLGLGALSIIDIVLQKFFQRLIKELSPRNSSKDFSRNSSTDFSRSYSTISSRKKSKDSSRILPKISKEILLRISLDFFFKNSYRNSSKSASRSFSKDYSRNASKDCFD